MNPKLAKICAYYFYIQLNILSRDTTEDKKQALKIGVPFNSWSPFPALESTIIYKWQINKSWICPKEIIKHVNKALRC